MLKFSLLKLFIIGSVFKFVELSKRKSYSGHQLYRIIPETYDSLKKLNFLASDDLEIDFWIFPKRIGLPVEILVPPERRQAMEKFLTDFSIKYEIVVNDFSNLIELEHESMKFNAKRLKDHYDSNRFDNNWFSFDRYHTNAEINSYLFWITNKYPDFLRTIELGRTFENRKIFALEISAPILDGEKKPVFFIEAGIHAREWIAPATALFIMNELISGYLNNDSIIADYVRKIDWIILPVMNPDGYEYSHTTDRLWRKNRNTNWKEDSELYEFCKGVDLNRNFDWHWGEFDISELVNHRCGANYAGTNAFSEPESQAIRDLVLSLGNRLKAYIALHSYGQIWSYPFTHKEAAYPANWVELMTVAMDATERLHGVNGTEYYVDTTANTVFVSISSPNLHFWPSVAV